MTKRFENHSYSDLFKAYEIPVTSGNLRARSNNHIGCRKSGELACKLLFRNQITVARTAKEKIEFSHFVESNSSRASIWCRKEECLQVGNLPKNEEGAALSSFHPVVTRIVRKWQPFVAKNKSLAYGKGSSPSSFGLLGEKSIIICQRLRE